ncbi:class I glutamine amidotransferase-like protein [Mrakia frigida]|uniref:type 1 glutamine amidotransferase n=1 Tax=Mrakia frigida TaxID=29902 RepID=UPI003FCC0E31
MSPLPPSEDQKTVDNSKVLTIAFLKCDKIPIQAQAEHGTYEDVLHNLLEPLLPTHLDLETLTYEVVHKRSYPTEAELERIDAIVISGSFEEDADVDAQWILRLAGFLIRVKDDLPRIRIVGICFGLQVIARAFGPEGIVKNPKGWEVGSTRLVLTEMGKKIIWGEGAEGSGEGNDQSHLTMQQIHGDIVPYCPSTFTLLASSAISPVQAIASFYPGDAPPFTHSHGHTLPEEPWRNVHIIAFQGHPEWHEDIIVPLIDNYEKDGTFDAEFAEAARQRARSPHDGIRVGAIILRILGVA